MNPASQKPPIGATINWNHPLAQGMVGCWLFNEGKGSKLNDYCGKHHGIISGAAWVRDGLLFNGTSDLVTITPCPQLDWQTPNGCTVFAIYNGSTAVDAGKSLFSVWNSTDNARYITLGQIPYNPYGRVSAFAGRQYSNNELIAFSSAGAMNTKTIAGTYTSTLGTVYVDGKSVGTDSTITTYSTLSLDTCRIGYGGQAIYSGYWSGIISTVMIYTRALSANEILQLNENPYQMILTQPLAPVYSPRLTDYGSVRR